MIHLRLHPSVAHYKLQQSTDNVEKQSAKELVSHSLQFFSETIGDILTGLRGPPKIIGGFVERAGDWLKKVVGERQLIFLRSGCLGDDCFHPASHHIDGPDLVPSGENLTAKTKLIFGAASKVLFLMNRSKWFKYNG